MNEEEAAERLQAAKMFLIKEGIADVTEIVGYYVDGLETAVEVLSSDRRELAAALKNHQAMAKVLKDSEDVLSAALIKLGVAFDGEHIKDVGWLKIRRVGAKIVYDNLALVSQICTTLSVDHSMPQANEDGEKVEIDVKDRIHAAVREALDFAATDTKSFNSWRKSKLEKVGIIADKYLEKEGGRLKVEISDFNPEKVAQ